MSLSYGKELDIHVFTKVRIMANLNVGLGII